VTCKPSSLDLQKKRHEDRLFDRFRPPRDRFRPPRRPAFFFWALVPPCLEREERLRAFFFDPELFPPRLDAPGEFEIAAARDFDIPFRLSASYCFRFLTCPRAIDSPTALRAP